MILEALNFLATWAASPRKKPGEVNSSIRLWSRARRCSRDWEEHEEHSKAFVLKNMEGLIMGRVAVVLGSGLLRDVPIEALSKAFREVWLYDLQHLTSVRLWARTKGLANLRFIHRDLSGPLEFLQGHDEIDLVISANLLSQIGLAHQMEDGSALVRAHLDGLKLLPGTRLLISDTAYNIISREGHVLESHDLLHGVTPPDHDTSWLWPVAPLGELDPSYKAVHRVIAARL